jgi:hypothetical protein
VHSLDRARDIPPGWDYNPAALSQRLPIVALALAGCAIATYLALFQYGVVATVWEPLFDDGSRIVLSSRLSRVLPVSDAALGAAGYLADAIAARAIVWASDHDRREHNVALPTVITIAGNKIAPGLGDWYLAKTGFDSQQTDEAVEPDRRDNLWEPVPGDHGAHGTFTDRAFTTCPILRVSMHRATVFGIAGGVAAALLARRKTSSGATWR